MSSIVTNIPSLVAARSFAKQNVELTESLRRLSTGLRINTGKDDPAGLIASEVLRAEVTATDAAIRNAKEADTFVSVAEGALNEINALLLELEDLVDRSANEAALSDDEIAANQLQIDSILDSINRIATSTEFKGKKLLDGTFDFTTQSVNSAHIDSVRVNAARIPNGGTRTVVVEVTGSAQTGELRFTNGTTALTSAVTIRVGGNLGIETFSFASGTALSAIVDAINQSKKLTGVSAAASGTTLRLNSTSYGSDQFVSVKVVSGNFSTTDVDGNSATKDFGQDVTATINGISASTEGLVAKVRSSSLDVELILDEDLATLNTASSTSFTIERGGATFSLSPTVSLAGTVNIGLGAVDTASLGNSLVGFLSSLGSGETNALNQKNFTDAQKIIREAVSQVASLRGRIGAFQKDTLQTTLNALQITFENGTAAESAIRDTDFARETGRLTRSQILVNASIATLQLANQLPQNVLALLG